VDQDGALCIAICSCVDRVTSESFVVDNEQEALTLW